jgi:hypothetical protein
LGDFCTIGNPPPKRSAWIMRFLLRFRLVYQVVSDHLLHCQTVAL